MQLGSDLTLMMLIEVDPSHSAALHVALAEHQRNMRDVHLITRTTSASDAPRAPSGDAGQGASRFTLAALDRPGLVHLVTSAFLRARERRRVQRSEQCAYVPLRAQSFSRRTTWTCWT